MVSAKGTWVFTVVLLLACGPERAVEDARATKVAVRELSEFMAANDSLILTLGDARRLIGFSMAAAFGETPPKDTMSIGEIVAWVDDAEARQAAREAQAERLAAEERAKLAAFRTEMESVLSVVLVEKGFLPSNYRAGRYSDYITFTFAYENKSPDDLRGFEGTVRFLDMFGDTITSLRLKVDDSLAAGARRRDAGRTLDYNQFVDEHIALRVADLANLKVLWEPETLIFADGRRLSAREGPGT